MHLNNKWQQHQTPSPLYQNSKKQQTTEKPTQLKFKKQPRSQQEQIGFPGGWQPINRQYSGEKQCLVVGQATYKVRIHG